MVRPDHVWIARLQKYVEYAQADGCSFLINHASSYYVNEGYTSCSKNTDTSRAENKLTLKVL